MIDTLKAEIERIQKSNLDLCQLLSKSEEEFSSSKFRNNNDPILS